MRLLEYEAKQLLKQSDIAVPDSVVVTADDTPSLTLPVVLKSQVPTGGRGKAGGIIKVATDNELAAATARLASLSIKGFRPRVLLAEAALAIKKEYYLSIFINRDSSLVQLLAHTNGGVEVEDNAADSFLSIIIDESSNFDEIGEQLAEYFELAEQTFALEALVKNLYRCLVQNDATLIEINPLVVTEANELIAGDAKMELDDAAAFRHPDWQFETTVADANFVKLNTDGTVATIANGAGLAMATVDAVAAAGLTPANFLDIGGGANTASVLAAFRKIMEFPSVTAIVINIFAGITRCDEVAKAIIAAKSEITGLPPLYIRLSGTNFEEAVTLLSAEHISTLSSLDECIAALQEEAS